MGQQVLIDMDGTLCRWAYPAFGMPTAGAREALLELRRIGLQLVVWSSRLSPLSHTPDERRFMRNEIDRWMREHNMPFDEIDDGNSGKRLALAYIDDRGAGYDTSHPTVEFREGTIDRTLEGKERLAWTNVVNRVKQIRADDEGIRQARREASK